MQKIGLILLRILLFPLRRLPLSVHYKLSGIVYFLVFKVFRYRYDDVMINLSRCFPTLNCYELRILCRQFYHHFADIVVEAVWFGGCRKPERLKKAGLVKIVNPEELERLHSLAPSMMVLYSHCGNWELYGGLHHYSGRKLEGIGEDTIKVVYRAASSKLSDAFIKENRFAPLADPENFEGYIESHNMVRYALTHRDRKLMYNVNTDQRPYYAGSDNMEVDFMGIHTKTMSAAAALARKCHMSVSFLRMDVESRGHYRMEFVTICDDASTMTVQEIMDRYYLLLEEEIRQQPWNYLWTHRRWMY